MSPGRPCWYAGAAVSGWRVGTRADASFRALPWRRSTAGPAMPEVDKNLAIWSSRWDWSDRGDERSSWWGRTPALWHGGLPPRIHSFVLTGTILEIAPGYVPWTQYLKDLA